MTFPEFQWACWSYCVALDASQTSGFRTKKHNQHVGGKPHSAHLVGLAWDVVYDHPHDLAERRDWAARLGLKVLDEGDHDHLQPVDWPAG